MQSFEAFSDGLRKLVDATAKFVRGDRALREAQSENAPIVVYFAQGTNAAAAVDDVQSVLSATANVGGINPRQEVLSYLVFVTDDLSGRGRYRIDDGRPTAAGVGIPIRSGFGSFTVIGNDNIWKLKWIAETGQVVNWTVAIFK